MTPDEFRADLESKSDDALVELSLVDDTVPYVFDARPQSWAAFRDQLAQKLDVGVGEIRIVGSGRFGFSLKPGNKFRDFRDTSDIDVVIVNSVRFDELWLALLRAAYPRAEAVSLLPTWLAKRRNELYTGWLSPLKIKIDLKIFPRGAPVMAFNAKWFNALKGASQLPTRRHEDISGRLYRTWEHAALYHRSSLSALRATLNS